VAEQQAAAQPAEEHLAGAFERDTAVALERSEANTREFSAQVASGWRAGRGPHGGYLAAMLLRALTETLADPSRSARSLTIHFLSAPEPGPVRIATAIERAGRSFSFLSANLEQRGKPMALALAAFSPAWSGPEFCEHAMPAVSAPEPGRKPGTVIPADRGGPEFAQHITLQARFGGIPFADPTAPMEAGGWIGLVEPRPLDALALAFFCDALIPAPFMRTPTFAPAPTIDITIHFRSALGQRAAEELVLARSRTRLVHEGFFEEDAEIWAADGTLLAQSRQLALLMG
jgi:acyl-CoA thioesterase